MNPLILEPIPRYGTLTFQVGYYTQLTPKILLLASLVGPKADLALPTQRLKDSKDESELGHLVAPFSLPQDHSVIQQRRGVIARYLSK